MIVDWLRIMRKVEIWIQLQLTYIEWQQLPEPVSE